ncbi:MAG: helix-turn-helix domain-containing protein, partial [Trebonia sp.]
MSSEQSNEQLKRALRNAGLEIDELASKVKVDVKTAQRWLTGRTPYPRYRRRVADALNVPEQVLWPSETPDHDRT